MSASNEKKINKSAKRQIHAVKAAVKTALINRHQAHFVLYCIANGKVGGRKRPNMNIKDYLLTRIRWVTKKDVEVHIVKLILEYTGENPGYYIPMLPLIPRDDECKKCGRTMFMAKNVCIMGNEGYVCRVCKMFGKPTPCRYCTRRQMGVVGWCCYKAYKAFESNRRAQAQHNESRR